MIEGVLKFLGFYRLNWDVQMKKRKYNDKEKLFKIQKSYGSPLKSASSQNSYFIQDFGVKHASTVLDIVLFCTVRDQSW